MENLKNYNKLKINHVAIDLTLNNCILEKLCDKIKHERLLEKRFEK